MAGIRTNPLVSSCWSLRQGMNIHQEQERTATMSRVFTFDGLESFEKLEQKLSLSTVTVSHFRPDDLPPPDPEPDPGPLPKDPPIVVPPVGGGG